MGLARLKQLLASLSSERPGFNPRSVHVEFAVDEVEIGKVFLQVLQFSSASAIPLMLHMYSPLCY
jgi:hypothetical protein